MAEQPSVPLAGIDLNLLVVFSALHDTHSVAKAARRLHLSASAVSHALGRLRKLVDDPLFVRTGKGMVPTPRASELAETVGPVLDHLESALLASSPFDPATAEHTFVISTVDYGTLMLLPRLLDQMATEAPGIKVITRPLAGDPVTALADGAIDVMIGVFTRDAPAMYRKRLFRERLVCAFRRDHPDIGDSLALDVYLAQRHVAIAPRGQRGGPVEAALEARRLSRTIVAWVPEFLSAAHLIARTDLLLTSGARFLTTMAESLPTRLAELPFDVAEFDVSMVWHARSHGNPAHRWLRSQLSSIHAEVY